MTSKSLRDLTAIKAEYDLLRQDVKNLHIMILAQAEQIDFLVTSTVALLHHNFPERFNADGTPKPNQDEIQEPKQDIKTMAQEQVSRIYMPQY